MSLFSKLEPGTFKAKDADGGEKVYRLVHDRRGLGTFAEDVGAKRAVSRAEARALAWTSGDEEAKEFLTGLAAQPTDDEKLERLRAVMRLFPDAPVLALHELTAIDRRTIVVEKKRLGQPY